MKFVTDESIKTAFMTMMNKLIFANRKILKPLLSSLQEIDDKRRMVEIKEYERLLEKNAEQMQVLTRVMAGGLLEPAVFTKEKNALLLEEQILQDKRRSITDSLIGDRTNVEALNQLIKFVSKGKMLTEFSDE